MDRHADYTRMRAAAHATQQRRRAQHHVCRLLLFGLALPAAAPAPPAAGHKFFQLMCCRIGGAHFLPGDDVKLAKFDIVVTANAFWKDLAHDGANSTWEAVRRVNPHTQFFAYRDSMACNNEDSNVLPVVNNVARPRNQNQNRVLVSAAPALNAIGLCLVALSRRQEELRAA